MTDDAQSRVLAALDEAGVAYRLLTHGPVRSLHEAAEARGVEPADVVKTLVVRRGDGDYVVVLVPGDRTLSWPKLRAHLGVSRLSMPDKDVALDVTGYERGTITPFGANPAPTGGPLPVIADALITARPGPVSIGAGAHGLGATLDPTDLVATLAAEVVDVTDPQ